MKRTIWISESISLPLPADDLWAFVEDYGNDTLWRSGLKEMRPTPEGAPTMGTTVHEVVEKLGSSYVTESAIIKTGERCYRFSGSGNSGGIEGGRSVRSDADGGAKFTYDIVLHLSGFLAIVSRLVQAMMVRGLRRDLHRLSESLVPK